MTVISGKKKILFKNIAILPYFLLQFNGTYSYVEKNNILSNQHFLTIHCAPSRFPTKSTNFMFVENSRGGGGYYRVARYDRVASDLSKSQRHAVVVSQLSINDGVSTLTKFHRRGHVRYDFINNSVKFAFSKTSSSNISFEPFNT